MKMLDLYKKLKKKPSHMIIFLENGEDSNSAHSESIETFYSWEAAVERRNLLANTYPYNVMRKAFPLSELAICTTDSYFGKKYLNS